MNKSVQKLFSVIVATRNRPYLIARCIKSILNNTNQSFEIILIDQSKTAETRQIVSSLNCPKIKYFHIHAIGKVKALNLALKKAKGDFVAFTDDDCIVERQWIKKFLKIFQTQPEISGIFGNTLPFHEKKHRYQICTACFISKKIKIVSNPFTSHYHLLGQGNNMCFRLNVIKKIGTFISWLGVGTFAQAGEDSEIIFRILSNNLRLMQTPKISIFHDHWLTSFNERILQGRYTCGLMAFMCFYIRTEPKLKKLIFLRLNERISSRIKLLLQLLLRLQFRSFYYHKLEMIYILWEIYCSIRGILTGLYMGMFHKRSLYVFSKE